MKISEVGTVEVPQNTVNMKSRMHEEAPQAPEQDPKEALTNPMETVGRSQVNFRGVQNAITSLSAKELNILSRQIARMNLSEKETKVAKQALIDTINEYGCKSVEEFAGRINKSIDSMLGDFPSLNDGVAEEMLGAFERNVFKIDPKVDSYRATSIIDDFIWATH